VPGIVVPGNGLLRDVHLRGPATSGAVALTFDDGPNGRCTEAVLDALADLHAPAAFFVVGRNLADGRNDALLARMVREGHTIGTHSQTHRARPAFLGYLTRWELRVSRNEITAALRRAGVDDPPPLRFFRPPYGFLLGPSARAADDEGLAIVGWTVSVEDWRRGLDASSLTARILERVRPGDVIVLHDGVETRQRSVEHCTDRGVVAEVVRSLLPALGARGLRVIPLGELLGIDEASQKYVDPRGVAH
jgi:chitooligosaccharide deacetylase